jgi:hypothetical protein
MLPVWAAMWGWLSGDMLGAACTFQPVCAVLLWLLSLLCLLCLYVSVVCCRLCVVGCLFSDVGCRFSDVGCLLSVVCCMLSDVSVVSRRLSIVSSRARQGWGCHTLDCHRLPPTAIPSPKQSEASRNDRAARGYM